jgi:hypothetical protein
LLCEVSRCVASGHATVPFLDYNSENFNPGNCLFHTF